MRQEQRLAGFQDREEGAEALARVGAGLMAWQEPQGMFQPLQVPPQHQTVALEAEVVALRRELAFLVLLAETAGMVAGAT